MSTTKYYAAFNQLNNPGPSLNLCDSSGRTMMFDSELDARTYVARNYNGAYNIIAHRIGFKVHSV